MKTIANRWTSGRSAASIGILIFGIALALAHEARAWGGRFGYGGWAEEGFMAAGTVAQKAQALTLVKFLPVVEAARYISIRAGARVRSSSRPIAASATPGPFSKAASIPRIGEFRRPAARRGCAAGWIVPGSRRGSSPRSNLRRHRR